MTKILILGAGTAGTMAANKLKAAHPNLDIAVVDQNNEHHYQPGYLFVPFETYGVGDVIAPRRRYLRQDVRFVEAVIDRVDPSAKVVHFDDAPDEAYDYLLIATGVTPRPDQTPGMVEGLGDKVHEFYTLDGAVALQKALARWQGGRLVVHICEMPIKCPVAPLEFAFLADDFLDQKARRRATHLSYVTPLDGAFTKPVASQALGDMLDERRIDVVTDFAIAAIDNERQVMQSYDGREIGFDLLVTVPVNMGADYVERSGLGNELNLVPCDRHTLKADGFDDIFVLGDAGTIPTSKAGSVAHFQIEVFVENFGQILAGKPMSHSFDGHANCFVESGRGKAVLLDFNYDTEPLTGTFPLPQVGPMKLLAESRLNHQGKLAFRWIYWNMLLRGRPLGLPAHMSMLGKNPAKH